MCIRDSPGVLPWFRSAPSHCPDQVWFSPGLTQGTTFGPVIEFDDSMLIEGMRCFAVKVPVPDFEWRWARDHELPRFVWIVTARHFAGANERYRHFAMVVDLTDAHELLTTGNAFGQQLIRFCNWPRPTPGLIGTLRTTARSVAEALCGYADTWIIRPGTICGRGGSRKGIGVVLAKGMVLDLIYDCCLLYTSPSPRDRTRSRMPSSA